MSKHASYAIKLRMLNMADDLQKEGEWKVLNLRLPIVHELARRYHRLGQ